MKRSSWLSYLYFLLVVGSITAAFYYFGSEIIKFGLQSYGYELCDCKLEIGQLKWELKRPSYFLFKDIKLDMVETKVNIASMETVMLIEVFDPTIFWKVNLTSKIQGGEVQVKKNVSQVDTAGSSGKMGLRELARKTENYKRLDASLTVEKIKINFELSDEKKVSIDVDKFKAKMQGEPFSVKWELTSKMNPPAVYFDNEVSLVSQGTIQRYPEKIELVDGQVNIMGIPMVLQGGFVFQSNAVNLKMKVKDFDVSKIQKVAGNNLLQTWSGKINVEVALERASNFSAWMVEGNFDGKDLKGQVELKAKNYAVSGPVQVSASSQIKYQSELGWEIPHVEWNLDLSESQVFIEKYFNKPPNVKLASHGKLQWKDAFSFEGARLEVDQLNLGIDGEFELSKRADITFDVKPMRVEGMEKYFPFLSEFPLKGGLELAGNYQGDLTEPDKATIQMNKIILDHVEGTLDWKTSELSLIGPFAIDFKGGLFVSGKLVKSGEIDMKIDLSKMAIKRGSQFDKSADSPFELVMAAREEGGSMRAKSGYLKSAVGLLNLEGTIPIPPSYTINLKLKSEQLSLGALRKLFPTRCQNFPEGQLKGDWVINGEFNPNDFLASRATTTGNMKVMIPNLTMVGHSPNLVANPTAGKLLLPGSILSKERAFQTTYIDADVSIGNLKIDGLSFSDITASVKIQDGKASGQSVIGRFFNGRVEFPFFEVPLLTEDPKATYKIKAFQVNFADLTSTLLTPFRGFGSGFISAEISGTTKLPSSPYFLSELQSAGNFSVASAGFSVFPLKMNIDQALRAVRGGVDLSKRYNFPSTNLTVTSDFVLARNEMSLKPLIIRTKEGHQAQLEGKIGLDRKIQMEGELVLLGIPPVNSFIIANRDQQGAIQLPFKVEGNFSQPNFHVLDDFLSQMVQKSYELERGRPTSPRN